MDIKKTQSGRSMVEMMGYLMVAMGVIVAVGRIVSSAFDSHKYSIAALQLSDLVSGIVRSSAIDVDYTNVINKAKKGDRELIPESFRVAGSGNNAVIYHAFGGTVTIDLFQNTTEKFAVTFNNLSKKQCVEMALRDWSKNQYADLFAIIVRDYTWYWQAYGTGDSTSDTLNVSDSAICSNKVCRLPVVRSRLTGVKDNDPDAQCLDERSNSVTWVFN